MTCVICSDPLDYHEITNLEEYFDDEFKVMTTDELVEKYCDKELVESNSEQILRRFDDEINRLK